MSKRSRRVRKSIALALRFARKDGELLVAARPLDPAKSIALANRATDERGGAAGDDRPLGRRVDPRAAARHVGGAGGSGDRARAADAVFGVRRQAGRGVQERGSEAASPELVGFLDSRSLAHRGRGDMAPEHRALAEEWSCPVCGAKPGEACR